jgi:hypothetical protein
MRASVTFSRRPPSQTTNIYFYQTLIGLVQGSFKMLIHFRLSNKPKFKD